MGRNRTGGADVSSESTPDGPPRGLGPRGKPERLLEAHPTDPAWRADALAGSRHSRLADEVRPPLADSDPVRAQQLCARITREVLRDFAPGLVFLRGADRNRVQALTAFARTLFDFARQRGLEGDRLALLNNWEFQTEEALSPGRGTHPPSQPVFVAMASAGAVRPWPRTALDRLFDLARSEAVGRPVPPRELATTLLACLWHPEAEVDPASRDLLEAALTERPGAGRGRPSQEGGDPSPSGERPPRGPNRAWRRAGAYAEGVLRYRRLRSGTARSRLDSDPEGAGAARPSHEGEPIGLGTRLRLLVAARLGR